MASTLQGVNWAKRREHFAVPPERLTLVTDKAHYLYDASVEAPLDETSILNVMAKGIIEPVIVAMEDDKLLVADGRSRTRWALAANERLKKEGSEPILVPILMRRGEEKDLFGVMVSSKIHRKVDSPLETARKVARFRAMQGNPPIKETAVVFGYSEQYIRSLEDLLTCAPAVRTAVERGEMPASIAVRLAKLTREEQAEKLGEMRKEGATRGAKAGRKVDRAVRGSRAAKGLKVPVRKRKDVDEKLATFRIIKDPSPPVQAAIAMCEWYQGDDSAITRIKELHEAHTGRETRVR